MKAKLRIHGLDLEFSSTHPWIFRTLLEDLRGFRVSGSHPLRNPIRWTVDPIPAYSDGEEAYPAAFHRYRHAVLSEPGDDPVVTRYLPSHCTVLYHPRKRRIESAVVPDPALLPDPGFHFLVTQPLSLLLSRRNRFLLHAGCVADSKGGILIVGDSRAGKTTLSLAALQGGFRLLSDEQPILAGKKRGTEILAFPRQIRLDRTVAGHFRELAPMLRASRAKRILFHAEKIWPRCLMDSCRPRVLVFPEFRPNKRLSIGRLSPSSALRWLLQDPHFVWYPNEPWTQIPRLRLPLLNRLVRQVKAYGLRYSNRDLPRIPDLFRLLLQESS